MSERLCKKCVEDYNRISDIYGGFDRITLDSQPWVDRNQAPIMRVQIVPESECEFWAHKAYNDLALLMANEALKEEPRQH